MTDPEKEIGEKITQAVKERDPEAASAVIAFLLERQRQMSKGLETMSKILETIQRLFDLTPKQQRTEGQQR